jgi:hypothetical protein
MSMLARTVLLVVLSALCLGSAAHAQARVDLELVLAVDVSLSMDMDEQRLQRDGYVAAFRDPEVWRAIGAGANGRIAVTYIEWAGEITQNTVLPWTLIDGPEAAKAFADRLEAVPISRARMTSISGALLYSARELERNQFKGTRRVVDVSGDGPNNSGIPAERARAELVAKGIVINGLPIVLKRNQAGFFDIANLDQYYAACVIGGTGAFMIPIRERGEFATATRRKLILEISGLMPEQPARLIRTQAIAPSESEPTDCMIGERMWRRYMDGNER